MPTGKKLDSMLDKLSAKDIKEIRTQFELDVQKETDMPNKETMSSIYEAIADMSDHHLKVASSYEELEKILDERNMKMNEDWYSDVDWAKLFATGESGNVRLTKTKEKQAKDLMQDKSVLETMRFFNFIGLQPTQFEDYWRVEFSLRDYQQYFHIEDRDKAYIDLQNRLDDATSVYKNETSTSWGMFHLVSGYDYANGIIQASITKKGKELIDKLRGMEDD